MPRVVITPSKGQACFIDVEDKAEAIRIVAQQFKKVFSDKSIQSSLNAWLSSSMRTPLMLQSDKEKIQLTYIP